MEKTRLMLSDPKFRLWGAISALSSAMERRVWTTPINKPLYANMYILFVGNPASGKSAVIDDIEEMWASTKIVKLAPPDMTKASMVDSMKESNRRVEDPGPPPHVVEYHSMTLALSEFGTLVSTYDNALMTAMIEFWNCGREYSDKRRSINKGETSVITAPQMSMLAGTQPAYLGEIMTDSAWKTGFAARLLMIYGSASTAPIQLFRKQEDLSHISSTLCSELLKIEKLYGEFIWDDDAAEELEKLANCFDPKPEHSKLEHYLPRRWLYVCKLSMVSAISRSMQLNVKLSDLERAKGWLLSAEADMPDIFREIVGRSDSDIITELNIWMWRQHAHSGKPINEWEIFRWVSSRALVERVPKILEIAERSHYYKTTGLSPDRKFIPLPVKIPPQAEM